MATSPFLLDINLPTEPSHVAGWEFIDTVDKYRICGVQGLIWFVQEPPYRRVAAHPPAHLTIWEALDWFRAQRREPAQMEGLA